MNYDNDFKSLDSFDLALLRILDAEGGYINDPNDPGGETKYGISKRQYPELDIKNLTRNKAANIYYHRYFLPTSANYLPGPIALIVFDMAVNSGVKAAIIELQRALKVPADGIIGPVTRKQADLAKLDLVIPRFLSLRAKFYTDIVITNRKMIRYQRGWLHRLFRLQAFIYDHKEVYQL